MQSVRSAPVVRLHLPVAARRAVPAALLGAGHVVATPATAAGRAGVIGVIYGSTEGLLAAGDQFLHQDTPGVASSNEAGDRFGRVLVAGNLGSGAQADLAVGVPFEDVFGVTDAGSVNVIYGSAGGLSPANVPEQVWHQDSADVEGAAGAGEAFGTALVAANLGAGTQADLPIGVPLERVGVADDAGAVSVIYGSTVRLSATATPDQLWHQNRPFVEDSCEEDDHAGAAVAAFG